MPDEAIDDGGSPPRTEAFWQNAVRNPFYRPGETSTTLRIEADVPAWPRAQGRGYQTRVNAILRRERLAALKKC